MKHRLPFVALLLLLLFAGCGDQKSESEPPTDPAKNQPVPEDLGPPLKGEPSVSIWSWDQTLEEVKSHAGKVVVLHIWTKWSETLDNDDDLALDDESRAKKQAGIDGYGFGEFVRMKRLHRDDVVAISLNVEYNPRSESKESSEEIADDVLAFAKKHGANFQHGASSTEGGIITEEKLDVFGLPVVLVFDKTGKQRQQFNYDEESDRKPFTYRDDVIPLVLKLAKEDVAPPEKPSGKPTEPKADDNQETPSSEDKNLKVDQSKTEDKPQEKVSLETRDWAGLEKLIAEQKGKVVVLDLWSTTCLPCMKEYPNLVKLHNAQKAKVACLSFNLDYTGLDKPETLKPTVLQFLTRQKSTFPNSFSAETDDAIYTKLELASIPAVFVYDKTGKLRKRFGDDGEFTYEKDVLPFVEKLVAE